MATPPRQLHDILILSADGQLLNTVVLNKSFTIKTNFGNVTAKTRDIVHITMEPRVPHELITNSGNILKGQIQDKTVTVVIFTGEQISFKLPAEVLSIQFLDNLHPSLRKRMAMAAKKNSVVELRRILDR